MSKERYNKGNSFSYNGEGEKKEVNVSSIRPEPKEGQVMDASAIVVGGKYIRVGKNDEEVFTVLSEPCPDHRYGGLWVDARTEYFDSSKKTTASYEKKISLADYGIVPDEQGLWNIWNYTKRLDLSIAE